jgi:3-oxoacyl-(acyl-carrier-protein) synthase
MGEGHLGAISNSFGFGGVNGTLVLMKFPEPTK